MCLGVVIVYNRLIIRYSERSILTVDADTELFSIYSLRLAIQLRGESLAQFGRLKVNY